VISAWKKTSLLKRCLALAAASAGLAVAVFISLISIELIAYSPILAGGEGLKSLKNSPAYAQQQALAAQGAYLAKLGNCAACHTDRGGAPYAGGKAIHTPFGAVFASNITPDAQHGIGQWSQEAFYRAMHHGVNAKGKLLAPAFPYPNTTHISRADSDALYAYFMHSVMPQAQPSKAHELAFPFNTQLALAVWRVLFFTPADPATMYLAQTLPADTTISIANYSIQAGGEALFYSKNQIERGRYIVQGLAHCSACHAQRNALGAASSDGLLSGALMPMQDWYAPSLHAKEEAGVQHWPREQVVALLKNGMTHNASVLGPMAEVVAKSTQYWREEDLNATAAYLQSLQEQGAPQKRQAQIAAKSLQQGAALYAQHCATCHGDNGQGLQEMDASAPTGKVNIPALADNRAVSLSSSANLVRIILAGGYAPSTAGNPRPYGMPPFVHVLTDEDIAAVTTYIRASWGNQANAVSASEVLTQRRGVLQ
jgi:mono/diheme cytochrome c family protein